MAGVSLFGWGWGFHRSQRPKRVGTSERQSHQSLGTSRLMRKRIARGAVLCRVQFLLTIRRLQVFRMRKDHHWRRCAADRAEVQRLPDVGPSRETTRALPAGVVLAAGVVSIGELICTLPAPFAVDIVVVVVPKGCKTGTSAGTLPAPPGFSLRRLLSAA